MGETLIENHNKLVKPTDAVYHLGDFSFGRREETASVGGRLHGRKTLIYGNHDHERERKQWTPFFTTVVPYLVLKGLLAAPIVLCHYAMRVWLQSHYGAIHLHGHSHGSLPPHGKSVDVGVDAAWITGSKEYRPFHLDEIVEWMQNRPIGVVDHHQPRDPPSE